MKWRAVSRKSSPVDERPGVAEYLENPRLAVDGEIRYRRGFARAQFSKASGAILAIIPASPSGNQFTGFQISGGTIVGETTLPPWWGDAGNNPFTAATPSGTATQGFTSVGDAVSGNGTFNTSVGSGFAPPESHTGNAINSTGGSSASHYQVDFQFSVTYITGTYSGGNPAYPASYPAGQIIINPNFSASTATSGVISYAGHPDKFEFVTSTYDHLFIEMTDSPDSKTVTGSGTWLFLVGGRTLAFTAGIARQLSSSVAGSLSSSSFSGTWSYTTTEIPTAHSASWTLAITRGAGAYWEDTYAIFAKRGSYPSSQNDGTASSLGDISITAISPSTSGSVTVSTTDTDWKFIAVPKHNGQYGTAVHLT